VVTVRRKVNAAGLSVDKLGEMTAQIEGHSVGLTV
jgi:hypothetical protein